MDATIFPIRGVCFLLLLTIGVAVLRVSGAPVSAKNAVGKDETPAKNHNELNVKEKAFAANTESASSLSAKTSPSSGPAVPEKRSLSSSKSEPAPVNRVPVNPVPGQIQRALFASSQAREDSKAAAAEGRRTNDEQNDFLEDEGGIEEEAPAAATAPVGDANQQWQYLLSDPRIQDLMANSNQDRQRFDSYPSSSSESLNSRALTDYLVRTGEIDRTLEELVDAGVMTSEEATLYREAINLEYGSNPQSTSNDKGAVDPEAIYDDGEPSSDVLYDGPNYLQPLPVDYPVPAADYFNLASQPLQQEEEDDESRVRSEDDYGQSTGSRFKDDEEQAEETNELLRDLLGTIALQEDGEESPSYKSLPAENEVQKPSLSSATSQWSSAEKQYDDDRGAAIEKELEALPTTGEGVKTAGTLEEQQLEEMRNRVRPEKTKQDNRTKPIKNSH